MRPLFLVQPETNCWEWQGHRNKDGYGKWSHGKNGAPEHRHYTAHRLAYIMRYGSIPEGKWVLHKCHNPACVNWEHLYLGDHAQNMKDRRENGKYFHGEKHPQCAYGDDVVREIMKSVEEYDNVTAKRIGVSRDFVRRVKLGLTRTHITGGALIAGRKKGRNKNLQIIRPAD